MASPITHAKISGIADGGDASLVRPSDWNAEHVGPNDQVSANGLRISDDCFWGAAATTLQLNGSIMQQVSGTGAAISSGMTDGLGGNHPGRVSLSTGTTATGRCALASGAAPTNFYSGHGQMEFGSVFYLITLSDGTNRYIVRTGLTDSAVGATAEFIGFRYTDNVNSGNWLAVTSAASVETTTDTGIAASTGWRKFEFIVNADGTSVTFYIDGTSVATHTTNIPTVRVGLLPVGIFKTAGTTARQAVIDAYWFSQDFTTNR